MRTRVGGRVSVGSGIAKGGLFLGPASVQENLGNVDVKEYRDWGSTCSGASVRNVLVLLWGNSFSELQRMCNFKVEDQISDLKYSNPSFACECGQIGGEINCGVYGQTRVKLVLLRRIQL